MNKEHYDIFIFEGKKPEINIFNSMKKYFLTEKSNTSKEIVYCNNIYQLFKEISEDGYLSLFELLKEQDDSKNIQDIEERYVARLYLFFDYDGHDSKADNDKMRSMIELFDNETENGRLYISYPMSEAIKHLKDDVCFKDTIENSIGDYKNLVSKNCDEIFNHPKKYTKKIWLHLINQHSKKANFIVHDKFEFPSKLIEQLEIFSKQEEKYFNKEKQVAVLSAFPIFLLDYYGISHFK